MKPRKASAVDVARRVGVSRTTVSFVLNNTPGKTIPENTRQKVLSAARSLGYAPDESARRAAMMKRHAVGLFITHSAYISSDAYILRLIEAVTPVFNRARVQLVLQPIKLREADYLALARRDRVDGVILINTHDADKGLAQLVRARFPLVVIGSLSRRSICQIDIDNRASACAAVSHLTSLGHSSIGMILHAPRAYYAARERYQGFAMAMQNAGFTVRAEWVREANLTEESGYRAMRDILGHARRPTAVFAGNDVIAYGAMEAIKDADLSIPDDMSIVGFDDDLPSRYVNPPLTSVTNPAMRLGSAAASMVISMLNGDARPAHRTILSMRLAVRGSCKAL